MSSAVRCDVCGHYGSKAVYTRRMRLSTSIGILDERHRMRWEQTVAVDLGDKGYNWMVYVVWKDWLRPYGLRTAATGSASTPLPGWWCFV